MGHNAAIGGITTALCIVIMISSALIPFSTYTMPAIAGMMLLAIALEISFASGYTAYAATSILVILMVPDKESVMMFIMFFGYYPLLKIRLDKIKSKILKLFIKLFVFNTAVLLGYWIIINLFGMHYLAEENFGIIFFFVLLSMANFGFLLYDYALKAIYILYYLKLRPKLFGNSRMR